MIINLSFLDPQGLRQIPRTHLRTTQKRNYLLADCFAVGRHFFSPVATGT
jgi:hypothetical protein